MAVDFVTVASAQTVSSAFVIERSDRALWCFVGSHAALGWRLTFAPTLAGPFTPLVADVVTGLTFPFSGTGGRWFLTFPCPPSNVARVEASAAVSATTSCMVSGG